MFLVVASDFDVVKTISDSLDNGLAQLAELGLGNIDFLDVIHKFMMSMCCGNGYQFLSDFGNVQWPIKQLQHTNMTFLGNHI